VREFVRGEGEVETGEGVGWWRVVRTWGWVVRGGGFGPETDLGSCVSLRWS
jgi:hypothetical protein